MMNTDDVRAGLIKGAAAAQRIDADGEAIRTQAMARHDAIQARLKVLMPKVNFDAAAADEYQALIAERGRLELVLAR
jgi:hypothetical protein